MADRYIVYGGEVADTASDDLRLPGSVHIAGVFETHDEACAAWKANAWKTVDNAHMRYFVKPYPEGVPPALHTPVRLWAGKTVRERGRTRPVPAERVLAYVGEFMGQENTAGEVRDFVQFFGQDPTRTYADAIGAGYEHFADWAHESLTI